MWVKVRLQENILSKYASRILKKIVGLCEDVPFKETLVPKERKSSCLTGIDYSLVEMQIDQMWLSTLKRMRILILVTE